VPSKTKQKIQFKWHFSELNNECGQSWCKNTIHFVARHIFILTI